MEVISGVLYATFGGSCFLFGRPLALGMGEETVASRGCRMASCQRVAGL